MKILHVISTLECHGAARQLSLLCQASVHDHEMVVAVLGAESAAAEALRARAVPVHTLHWTRPLPLTAWWRLRRLVRSYAPDIIHCWDIAALRAVRSAARTHACLVASAGLRVAGWLDRRLLRGVDRIARLLPAAPVELGKHVPAGLPSGRRIVCAGRLHPDKGMYDAIWAADLLRVIYTDVHLLILGEGPDRPRLDGLVRGLGATGHVHFLGSRNDALEVIAQADVVWVPDRVDGGVNVTLEAMAAGRPVVASRLPSLAEIVVPGATGFLVPVGDKASRARRTRELFDDPARAQRLGDAGRLRARQHFSIEQMVTRCLELYEGLGASHPAARSA